MNYLISRLEKHKKFNKYLEKINGNRGPVVISGLSGVGKIELIEATKEYLNKNILVLTYNEIQANRIKEDLKYFEKNIYLFPKRDIVTYDYEVESSDIYNERIETLNKIIEVNEKRRSKTSNIIVVTSIESIMQKMISKDILYSNRMAIKISDEIDMDFLKDKLMSLGYERDDIVDSKGKFAVHGGIVDIGIDSNRGIRIEFWGDEIDSIKIFSIMSQRSIDSVDEIIINPCKETILADSKENIIEKIKKNTYDEEDIEIIKNGNYASKIDKYFNSFYDNSSTLLDYLNEKFFIMYDDIDKIISRCDAIKTDYINVEKDLLDKDKILYDSIKNIAGFDFNKEVLANSITKKLKRIFLEENDLITAESKKNAIGEDYEIVEFHFRDLHFYKSEIEILVKAIKDAFIRKDKIIILAGNKAGSEILGKILDDNKIIWTYTEKLDENVILSKDVVTLSDGNLSSGFEDEDINLLVITGEEFLAEEKQKRRKYTNAFKEAQKVSYQDLNVGDIVVHKTQGIGMYSGINTITSGDITKDYIKITYRGGDSLYVPTDSLDNVRKYIGGGESEPRLNKLGSKEWEHTKTKVKNNLRMVAKDLIQLYARRQNSKGYKFSEDTPWQKQFEDSFQYEETGDQLRCIEEVKADMEKDKPMDRLLCGDVGYGKTEIAIRAAFKAVMDQKQVAYLAPTTILANQQYTEFKERMEKFAIRVEVLNRFVTKKKQKEVLKKLQLGEVDVLIGTHRLLSEDVIFKDLGLLIIDEEHRFGVKAKEKIKKIKENVDVLTMTATPIPRTLHMSIVGIRDMSVIYEPPHNRKAVRTYVLEYDKEVIKEAITKELERKGQVYYLYNDTGSIARKALEISELVPDSKVAFAHGKMSGDEIEAIMNDFINHKTDVIVCTTILEAGIDIPNANTMIVENADRLGLSQLYQIRGRVGRSDKQAYAYITYKRNKMLSEVADKRLKAIKEFTEFGSGFKVAMRDLEIRGAGSLLGEVQSGHMAQVGYDTYCNLLDEVIKEEQGEVIKKEEEVQIDLKISSYIPDSYIENSSQKIEMYQNIAICRNDEDITNITDELIDRFGNMPKETENLIEIAKIKNIARKAEVLKISQKDETIAFYFSREVANKKITDELISKLVEVYGQNLRFSSVVEPYISINYKNIIKNINREKNRNINKNNVKMNEDKEVIKIINNFLKLIK